MPYQLLPMLNKKIAEMAKHQCLRFQETSIDVKHIYKQLFFFGYKTKNKADNGYKTKNKADKRNNLQK